MQDGPLPLVPPRGFATASGLRSLKLTVGSWAEPPVLSMLFLTSLELVGVGEHRPGDEMQWLAALPALEVRRWHVTEWAKHYLGNWQAADAPPSATQVAASVCNLFPVELLLTSQWCSDRF